MGSQIGFSSSWAHRQGCVLTGVNGAQQARPKSFFRFFGRFASPSA
jgi:hypothetical protein